MVRGVAAPARCGFANLRSRPRPTPPAGRVSTEVSPPTIRDRPTVPRTAPPKAGCKGCEGGIAYAQLRKNRSLRPRGDDGRDAAKPQHHWVLGTGHWAAGRHDVCRGAHRKRSPRHPRPSGRHTHPPQSCRRPTRVAGDARGHSPRRRSVRAIANERCPAVPARKRRNEPDGRHRITTEYWSPLGSEIGIVKNDIPIPRGI